MLPAAGGTWAAAVAAAAGAHDGHLLEGPALALDIGVRHGTANAVMGGVAEA